MKASVHNVIRASIVNSKIGAVNRNGVETKYSKDYKNKKYTN